MERRTVLVLTTGSGSAVGNTYMPHLLLCCCLSVFLISRRCGSVMTGFFVSIMIVLGLLDAARSCLIMYNMLLSITDDRSIGKGWRTGTLHRLVRLFSARIMMSFRTSLVGVIILSICFISYIIDPKKKT